MNLGYFLTCAEVNCVTVVPASDVDSRMKRYSASSIRILQVYVILTFICNSH